MSLRCCIFASGVFVLACCGVGHTVPHRVAPCKRMGLSWFLVMSQALLVRLGRCCLLCVPVRVLGVRRSACTCLNLLAVVGVVLAVVGWRFVVFDVFDVLGGFWMRCFAVSESDCIYWCCVCWKGHGGFRGGRKSS